MRVEIVFALCAEICARKRIRVPQGAPEVGKGGGGYWEDQGYEWYAGS